MKTDFIRARVEPNLKIHVHALLDAFGVTPTQLITMLYKYIEREHKIPLELAMPNAATKKAIKEARQGVGINKYESVDAFIEQMDIKVNAKSKNKKAVRKRRQASIKTRAKSK